MDALHFFRVMTPMAGRLHEIRINKWNALLAAILCFSGCASEVVRYPAELSTADWQQEKRHVILQNVSIRLDSGYERTIKLGTEFVEAGQIKQGRVLKPTNAVFTVEGAHMHEAYPVIYNGRVVGFYLPVEKSFSPLSLSIPLPIQERKP